MSAWLTATLLTIIAAGFALTAWLRREADRAWAEHQRRQVFVRIMANTAQFQAGMRRAAVAMADFGTAVRRLNEVLASARPIQPSDIDESETA